MRKYGKTPLYSKAQLSAVFESLPYITTALLFGSRASGDFHVRSDYDFALKFDQMYQYDFGFIAQTYKDIALQLKLQDEDLDIVDLEKLDKLLKDEILSTHILLKGEEDELSRLLR